MEVIAENAGLLSNLEVYMLLKDIRAGQVNKQKLHKSQHNLATITYETVKYLERSPCGQQTPENVASFMKAMKNFNLTKAEKLQLLNHRPTSAVEIQLMIEESEERLTEEQIYQLLSVIAASLPGPEPEQPPVSQEAEGERMETYDNDYEQMLPSLV